MARLVEKYKKILEARTLYSPYGESNAIRAFRISKGEYRPTSSAVERFNTNISYGIGPEGKGSRRSQDVTNRMTINDYGKTVGELVRNGKINPRKRASDYLKRKIRINEEKLRVFDFDDTVATTKSKVILKNKKTGKTKKITPAQYATYKPTRHEERDFSEFDAVIKPKRVKEIHNIIKKLAKKKRSFMILTARGNKAKKPIRDYLKKHGLYHPDRVRISTVGSSDPEAKSKKIEKHLNTGKYTHLEFFDDSGPNVEAVAGLKKKYPHVRIRSRKINYSEKHK